QLQRRDERRVVATVAAIVVVTGKAAGTIRRGGPPPKHEDSQECRSATPAVEGFLIHTLSLDLHQRTRHGPAGLLYSAASPACFPAPARQSQIWRKERRR